MKQILIIIIFLLTNTNSFADKRFEKDLKKLSKYNFFVDKEGNRYELDQNIDKDKTIIIIYSHGSGGSERKLQKCKQSWWQIPPTVYQLDGIKIKDFTIKTYQLCKGVRGFSQKDGDLFWDTYDKNNQDINSVLGLKDKNGKLLIQKWEGPMQERVIKLKIDEFKKKGFNNIVLSGHSAGGWDSLVLKSNYPSEIDGVIAFHPARSGKFAKAKKPHKGWINWRNYKISMIKVEQLENVLVFSHEKDKYENPKTTKFLSDSENVIFVDVSDTNCKKKLTTGGWHGITLTKCFAESDPRSKEIIKYLNKIY